MSGLKGVHVTVIGGCGFLGGHIIEALHAKGAIVNVFDMRKGAILADKVTYHVGDLCKEEDLLPALKGVQLVIHCASPPPSSNDVGLFRRVNITGTETIIAACRQAGVKALVLTSSASVLYEGTDISDATESLPYAAYPMDPYTQTKIVQEQVALAANDEQLRTGAIRPHGIFGPRDPQLVPTTVNAARQGKMRFKIGNGQNLVDFTFVANVVHGHLLLGERLLAGDKQVAGQTFHITNDEPILFWDFLGRILVGLGYEAPKKCLPYWLVYFIAVLLHWIALFLAVFGKKWTPTFTPMRVALAGTHHYYSCEKAKRLLKYKPLYTVEQGIDITVKSYPEMRNAATSEHEKQK